MITKKITLDVNTGGNQDTITVKQGDTESRILIFTLSASGNPVLLNASNTTVTIRGMVGTSPYFDVCTVREDGQIEYTIKNTFTTIAGQYACELTVYEGVTPNQQILYSPCFTLIVEPYLYDDSELEADDRYAGLSTLVNKAQAAVTSAETAQGISEAAQTAAEGAATAAEGYAGEAAQSEQNAINANTQAQLAKTAVETAKTSAEAAETNAESARDMAIAKAQSSEAWAVGTIDGVQVDSSAIQYNNNSKYYAEQARLFSQIITRYGVSFGGSANTGVTVTRLYNAVGLVANVGTDTATATNDFDNIYPWNARRRCCCDMYNFDADGNPIVNAYKGEPGYIENGSNGEVMNERRLAYFKHFYDGDAEQIEISAMPLAGYSPMPTFQEFANKHGYLPQKLYSAAYPMATVNGKATSRAGVFSDTHSLDTAMTAARTLGNNYCVTTAAEIYEECLYMWVEFATRDLQAIMTGASNMSYQATDTTTVAEDGANRVIVTNAVAAKYVIGQTILIGTSLGSSDVANNRIITAIADYDADNKAILFDGDAVNVAVGNIVCTAAWKNGSCNSVLSSSGSPVSNISGKYNCIYRGKETPYGNAYELISDILFSRQGGGTTEDPYTYDIYFLSDPTKYNVGTITSDYVKLNYQAPTADGYVKTLGLDSRFPFLRIPSQIGASTTTYYSDYYYHPRDAVGAARVGGLWSNGTGAGPCYWYCNNTPSNSRVIFRARLSYHNK